MKTALLPHAPVAPARRAPAWPPSPDSDFGVLLPLPDAVRRAMRVLVVEDDPVQGLLMMLFLERFGLAADLVTDGAQGIAAMQTGKYTLVLMDCLLPVIGGVQATRTIRRWERERGRRATPIIAVTASCMNEQCRQYLDAGMDRVLRKPFSARDFGEVVRHYLLAPSLRAVC